MASFVYLLECADHTLYVGHTQDLQTRIQAHNDGRASAHTSGRRPVRLLYSEERPTVESAVKRERQLKGWTREKKLALAAGDTAVLKGVSRRNRM